MPAMISALRSRLARFLRADDGNTTLEVVIFVPLMLTIMAATFSLYDAFRYKSLNNKAAYTISDALSRETDPVDDAYLDGMLEVLKFLTRSDGVYSMRVSMVRYNGTDNVYEAEWSAVRGGFDLLTSADLPNFSDRLPQLLHNERVIVVETSTMYAPPFTFDALPSQEFYNFVTTRPRFAPKLVLAGT
ncbi:TadE/TadG family type IV pilus assembly protein [Salipiger mucosus]|uniref:Flp pilus assembly protein TadG n=1 Tax=Salipiger mucosus DSM 16094 TaxID=1123237 RepID=S9SH25_9RHOB|nr:hypothetical protein [Salipiger mucosus]EPX85574.1 hypothetical protein Salmuc_04845 [Salipiger mucosus DSM 16094]